VSNEISKLIKCKRCGQEKLPHKNNPHLCVECAKAEQNRISYFRQHNNNWMQIAKEAGLELWERQPGETDREWQVWLAYRDAYPSIKPTYRKVAEQLGTTINVVKKVGQRWNFPLRLQAWAKHVDELTQRQREKEIVEMNKRHIEMATKLQEKIQTAINNINPHVLEPKDIKSLFQLSAELERKARLDKTEVSPVKIGDNNPELKKIETDANSLGEVIKILQGAGLVPKSPKVGIETTQRIVLKEDDEEE
jgi:ribosomal protein L32